MRRTLRLALAVLGIAAAVYGAASLTGGWLGTPPWSVGVARWEPLPAGSRYTAFDWSEDAESIGGTYREGVSLPTRRLTKSRQDRPVISAAVIAAGLALAAVALWPRRVPAPPSIPVQYRERG